MVVPPQIHGLDVGFIVCRRRVRSSIVSFAVTVVVVASIYRLRWWCCSHGWGEGAAMLSIVTVAVVALLTHSAIPPTPFIKFSRP